MSTIVQGRVRATVLALFTTLLGVTLGAGLYELRIEVPQWIEQTATGYLWNAEAAREADTGRRFWAFVTTGPLTLLTLASLVLGRGARGALRRSWLAAAVVSTADRAVTFAYFIPGLLTLMTDTGLSPSDAADMGLQWAALDLGPAGADVDRLPRRPPRPGAVRRSPVRRPARGQDVRPSPRDRDHMR